MHEETCIVDQLVYNDTSITSYIKHKLNRCVSGFFLTWRAELMDNFPHLFTTEVQIDSSSETSGEWDSDILGPHSDYLVAPTHELKNFGKFQLSKLTREGRERVKSLCTNPRR